MRLQKQLGQDNFLLDTKRNLYEIELELEMELEEVGQKACGIPILGDVRNLADKEGSDLPWCHSPVSLAGLGFGPDSSLSFLII